MTRSWDKIFLLEVFKGLAILLIVCFHLLENFKGQYVSVLDLIIRYGYLGNEVFFVISGFGISLSIEKTLFSKESVTKFLLRRLNRIYIPYWIHIIFAAIIIQIIAGFLTMLKHHLFVVEWYNYSFYEWVHILFLTRVFSATSWQINIPFLPLNGVIWFIAIIVQIYIVCFISLLLFPRNYKKFLFFIFVLSVFSLLPSVKLWVPYGLFLPYFSEFYIGMIVSHLIEKKYFLTSKSLVIFYFFLLFVIGMILVLYMINSNLIFAGFVGLLLWILYPIDKKLNGKRYIKLFFLIGNFSYSLYLMHSPLRLPVGMVVRNLVPLHANIATPLINIPIIILLSYIWSLFFERPFRIAEIGKALRHPTNTLSEIKKDIAYLKG